MSVVRLSMADAAGLIKLKPLDFLGPERFAQYRAAVEGARYDRHEKAYLASVDKLHAILSRLRGAGLDAEIEAPVHRELLKLEAHKWNDLQAAQDRIALIDEEIQKQSQGKEKLFQHQKVGACWLTLRHGALLADEQGVGKTLTAITAIPAGVPVLVVGPAVAKSVWMAEVKRWRPHMRVSVLKGRNSFRWPEPGEMLVSNYDIMPEVHGKRPDGSMCTGELPPEPCPGCWKGESGKPTAGRHIPSCEKRGRVLERRERCQGCHGFLKLAHPRTVVIYDEAHMLRNSGSKRARRASGLAHAARGAGGRTWLLTGTPMVNAPNELWNCLAVADLAREAFGSWKDFLELFNGQEAPRGGVEWGEPGDEIVERMQRVSLRRMRRDVLKDLPPKLYQSLPVEIDASTLKACESFLREQGKSVDEIVRLLAEEKFPIQLMSRIRAALATAKIPAMLELVEDNEERGEPLIVFSAHRAPIDTLAKRPGWAVITGDTSVDKRGEIERDFQAGKYLGIGLTIQAGGVAITLTHAHEELFVDRAFTPAENAQAEDRAARIGQRLGVIVKTLVGNHALDERVTEILIAKTRLITLAVDASAANDSQADPDFEEHLKRIQEELSSASGRALRRQAESDEERRAVKILHEAEFRPADQRWAFQLAEEAHVIGLSSPQWKVACDVARRAIGKKDLAKRFWSPMMRKRKAG
jgi:SNF2 family DNA or RNA helicase